MLAIDNRGHGQSSVSYDPADYTPPKMAGDAAALLRHVGVERAHVMGYSMGARISAFLALAEPGLVATLVFGGLGIGILLAWWMGVSMAAYVHRVTPANPLVLAGSALLVVAVAFAATLPSARRAAATQPARVLRS